MFNNQHTVYAIFFTLHSHTTVQVGKLGTIVFPSGNYIYVGSAKRNIQSRIQRHLQVEKRKHWHIDYIRPYSEITHVQTYSSELSECKRVQQLFEQYRGQWVAKKFGSSDCRCFSHLIYYKQ
ncbi:Uri superfamily endonuclease [Anoxybacillus tengchongensis]|uniref:Uri superfamily endonuclease n=1 Tax=Anoxybacillus tengchongensis TaxID=576944 RepID=A0A7X0DB69_9BACL|nr:GIY-YIG nuclease family protein [Anoxybacillus tengchongensis]MBB6176809.1 Uri superfamily endonuclease [Anoxybacillus tengchongensis]